MNRGFHRTARLFVPLWLLVTAGFAPPADDEDLAGGIAVVEEQVTNLERRLERLQGELGDARALTHAQQPARRLVEAHALFEQGSYAKAAVLLSDLVENPRFASDPEHMAAAFLLGRALYLDRNFGTARSAFERVAQATGSGYEQLATAYLIEIALQTRNPAAIPEYLTRLGAVPAGRMEPETLYALGRAFFQVDEYDRALRFLEAVGSDAAVYAKALYYIGAIHVAQGRIENAAREFSKVAGFETIAGGEAADPALREMAYIALGRLRAEAGDATRAAQLYAQVSERSKRYPTALYETAWALINAGELRAASDVLDLLLFAVREGELELEAFLLKGRLELLLEHFDVAEDALTIVVERYDELQGEIRSVLRDRRTLVQFFDWLLAREAGTVTMERPLSERAIDWVVEDDSARRTMQTLRDLARTRADIEQSDEMARRLDEALAADNVVELFPNLALGWRQIVELQNLLTEASGDALRLRARLVGDRCSAEAEQLATLRSEREQLARRVRAFPRTVADYEERDEELRESLASLERQAFVAETKVRLLGKQLEAIDDWLRTTRRQDATGASRPPSPEVLARVASERESIQALHDEVRAVLGTIGQTRAAIGSGDAVERAEAELRHRLLRLHRAEHELLASCAERTGVGNTDASLRIERLSARLASDIDQARALASHTADGARRKAREVRQEVASARRSLTTAAQTQTSTEDMARQFAGEAGQAMFERADARLDERILTAELGLVDVAWRRKQAKTGDLRALQRQRGKALRQLESIRSSLMGDEPSAGAGNKEEESESGGGTP